MMKKKVKSVLCDNDVFDFLDEIKQQLSTNWVYLNFKVLKTTEKCKCFEEYKQLKQLNGDGSCTELIRVIFKKTENEFVYFEMENCKLGKLNYYVIHSLNSNDTNIIAPAEPKDVTFFTV